MPEKPTLNELSRLQELDKIPPRGFDLEIVATPEERAAVARRLGLRSLSALTATLSLHRESGDIWHATGQYAARLEQECVVTLEPVPTAIAENIAGVYGPAAALAAAGGDEISDGLDEIIEPITNGMIDLGELVTQHLAMALDPYPRSPNAKNALPEAASGEKDRQKPFANLASLMQQKQKNKKK